MLKYIKALVIAIRAHKGQKDKAGKPYIMHPIRVAFGVKGLDCKVVALLHDVLEDSKLYTIDDFRFLNSEQKDALLLLTHEKNEPYFDYIDKIKQNRIARAVKISDLKQNSNLNRLKQITDKDIIRCDKYKKAIMILN